jgi:hypothetical protein
MHALGLIHRDVKPANILLDRERDRAVLVDVGVAIKAGDQRDAAGTPGFAAPESFLEQEGGPQTDVYGLASTMYCAITGRPPFGSGPAPQVVQRQLHDSLTPPSQLRPNISEGVDAVLAKALAPASKKRWASSSTFALALGRALQRNQSDASIKLPPVEPDDAAANVQAILRPTEGLEAGEMFSIQSMRPLGPDAKPIINGRVRAAHLRVLTRIVSHHIGESGMAKLKAEHPSLANVLATTLAPLAWVELAELVGALDSARQVLPNAMLPRKVGRGTMSATFSRLFGAEPSSLSAETVLAALPTFWTRYHEWGGAEATVRSGAAEITLEGYSGSVDVCELVTAEIERIVELTGARAVASSHPRCKVRGGGACEFRLNWQR